MLARVAENVYWMARYLERAESLVRSMRVYEHMLLDLPMLRGPRMWWPLVAITGAEKHYHERYASQNERDIIAFLLSDADNASSLVSTLRSARENLRASRSLVPRQTTEAINTLYAQVTGQAHHCTDSLFRQRFAKQVEQQLLAIGGSFDGAMSHDMAYNFLCIGRDIERADMTSRVLDIRTSSIFARQLDESLKPFENRQWIAVLRSVTAFQMYLAKVRRPVRGRDVLAFLLFDRQLPRAYRCCVDRLEQGVRYMRDHHDSNEVLVALRTLDQNLLRGDPRTLSDDPPQLHDYIDRLQLDLGAVGGAIATRYFATATADNG